MPNDGSSQVHLGKRCGADLTQNDMHYLTSAFDAQMVFLHDFLSSMTNNGKVKYTMWE